MTDDPEASKPGGRLIAAALLGLAAVIGGGAGLGTELNREPTAQEIADDDLAEPAARWRLRPAGEVFPAEVGLAEPGRSIRKARRVGIAAPVACAQAFDAAVVQVLGKSGCQQALRATYVDASGYLVTTVGIAVMPDSGSVTVAAAGLSAGGDVGVRAVGFSGTTTAGFGDGQRQLLGQEQGNGPYLVFHSSGWIDGRATLTGADRPSRSEGLRFGSRLAAALLDRLAKQAPPCEPEGAQC